LAFEIIDIVAVTLIAFIALAILLSTEWRLSIGLLAAQYIAISILIGGTWPFLLSVTVVIAGWLGCAVLGMAMLNRADVSPQAIREADGEPRINLVLNLLAASLIFLFVISFAGQVNQWIPAMDNRQSAIAFFLICLGLFRLSTNRRSLPTSIALLTVLSGFEILFARLTSSYLSAGLLAGVTLFLSLAGSYLILAPSMEDTR
jgi:hydrogenase-4 membrane subunit HyfE